MLSVFDGTDGVLSERMRREQQSALFNPLQDPLPNAPDLKILCLYGVGISTERNYYFRRNLIQRPEIPYVLDTDYNVPPWVRSGVRYTEGDGSVPLLSLGYMCSHGWKSQALNPSNVTLIVREFRHTPVSMLNDPRGGPESSDHVDIMGNFEMIQNLLAIVSDSSTPKSRIISRILDVAP